MKNARIQRNLQLDFLKLQRCKIFMKRSRQRGTATVEFGLLLPLFLLLLFGIVEFGLALYNKSVITTASREGARFGIVLRVPSVSPDDIRSRVLASTRNSLVSLGAASSVTVEFPTQADPNHLAVRVNYTFGGLAVGSLLSALGSPLVLTSTTVMVKE
jgi:Flp pilus assembly protein TadG